MPISEIIFNLNRSFKLKTVCLHVNVNIQLFHYEEKMKFRSIFGLTTIAAILTAQGGGNVEASLTNDEKFAICMKEIDSSHSQGEMKMMTQFFNSYSKILHPVFERTKSMSPSTESQVKKAICHDLSYEVLG